MNKESIIKVLEELKKNSVKRNFNQSVELIINLKDIDVKKTDQTFELFVTLPNDFGRQIKTCCLIGPELKEQSKSCDKAILQETFKNYQGEKKTLRKLAGEFDYFIAQANLMADIAKTFGSVLGPKKKMPNPKAGCVIPGAIPSLEPLAKKLQNTIRLQTKNELSVKAPVGIESMKDEELAENILAAYNNLLAKLPQEKNNIKYAAIKLTMGPLIKIEEPAKLKK